MLWESERMKAFNEASAAIAKRAEEYEVCDFAHKAIWDAEKAGEKARFSVGNIAVMAGEDPNNEDEKDRKDNAPITF